MTSNYSAIKSFDEFKINKIQKLEINSQEWSVIEDLHKILLTFNKATQHLSRRKYPSFSSCFVVYKLLSHFLLPNETDGETITFLKRILRIKLEYHLKAKLSSEQVKLIKVRFYKFFVNKTNFLNRFLANIK